MSGVTRTARAAEYVRMSTDHQKYSTENQADAIRQYAAKRGIEIVRTYADEGKSGLQRDGRPLPTRRERAGEAVKPTIGNVKPNKPAKSA